MYNKNFYLDVQVRDNDKNKKESCLGRLAMENDEVWSPKHNKNVCGPPKWNSPYSLRIKIRFWPKLIIINGFIDD